MAPRIGPMMTRARDYVADHPGCLKIKAASFVAPRHGGATSDWVLATLPLTVP
jgi:hypothetical protein